MGALCGKNLRQPKRQSSLLKKIEQLDFEMHFNVSLQNFKGKNIQKDSSYITIQFAKYKECKSLVIYHSSNPNYRINEKFSIKIFTRSLKENYMTIKLYDGKNNYNGNVTLSLYEIATGPIHNDYVINSKNKYLGRIGFDIIMTQRITFGIQCHKLQANFDQLPQRDRFFNLFK